MIPGEQNKHHRAGGFGGGLLSEPLKKLCEEFPKIAISLTVTDEPKDIISTGLDVMPGYPSIDEISAVGTRDLEAHFMCLCRPSTCKRNSDFA